MMEKVKQLLSSVFGRSTSLDNKSISAKQKLIFKMGIFLLMFALLYLFAYVQSRSEGVVDKGNQISKEDILLQVDLPDKELDIEAHWRVHFEEIRAQDRKAIEERLKQMQEEQTMMLAKADEQVSRELEETREKLKAATNELIFANNQLRIAAEDEKERKRLESHRYQSPEISSVYFDSDVDIDTPKPVSRYIPEGTYFTGHLLGGVVVSTALNAPDESATPVSIRLTSRGNLASDNNLDISKCRIMGSAYGDISSERAIIRLEKMVCQENGSYVTSRIAGQIFGPDGYNGIKGKVIDTSSKHIKNAAIGGVISGFSSAAKGSEGISLGAGGLLQTQKKGAKEMLGEGAMNGASSAGEKLAEYYLRRAEAMSPVLAVPSGVRVNTQITKGFYVGEVSTHRKIEKARGGQRVDASRKVNNVRGSNVSGAQVRTRATYEENLQKVSNEGGEK